MVRVLKEWIAGGFSCISKCGLTTVKQQYARQLQKEELEVETGPDLNNTRPLA